MPWQVNRSVIPTIQSLLSAGVSVILTNSSTYTVTSAVSAVLANEIATVNGYSRRSWSPGSGSFNTTKNRQELGPTTVNFTASGGNIVYDRVALIVPNASQWIAFDAAPQSPSTILDGNQHNIILRFNYGIGNVDVESI